MSKTNNSDISFRERYGKGKQFIILVGNIASGKSSICRKLVSLRFFQAVSLDALRYMLGAGYYYFGGDVERVIWKAESQMIRDLMKYKYNIIVDDAKSVSRLFREPLIELAKKNKYHVIVIETPTVSKKESVERRLKDNHGETSGRQWGRVYDRFRNMYEMPSEKEGIDLYIKMKTPEDIHEVFAQVGVK